MKNRWQTTELGQLCQLISGQHIDAKDYNTECRGVGYLTGPSDFGPRNPVISKWTETPKIKARIGDILITVKGSGVGKINLLDQDEVAISRQLMAVRVTGADPRFVHAFLSSKFDHFQSLSTGAAIPGISRDQVLGLEIAAPPLPEQKRIVAVLDEAFEGIAAAVANAEKNLVNARELFDNYLNSVFTRSGEGWVEKTLGEIGGDVFTGPFGSLLHKSDYIQGGVPLVNPAHIIDGKIVPDAEKTVDASTMARLQNYRLNKGDVILGRRGEIGRCAVVTAVEEGWLCGTGCFYIRVFRRTNPFFLTHLLRSRPYRENLESLSSGTTMLNLSNTGLSGLSICLPQLEEQDSIVAKAEALSSQIEELESLYRQKLSALAELKQSILQKAFAGELTAQPKQFLQDAVA